MNSYLEWLKSRDPSLEAHAHCPFNHEHPQPFVENKVLYCGKCWHDDAQLTEMVLCTPEMCIDESPVQEGQPGAAGRTGV